MIHKYQKVLLLLLVTAFVPLNYSRAWGNDAPIFPVSELWETPMGNSEDLAGIEENKADEWPWDIGGEAIYIEDNQPEENLYLGLPDNRTIIQETYDSPGGENNRVRGSFPLLDF